MGHHDAAPGWFNLLLPWLRDESVLSAGLGAPGTVEMFVVRNAMAFDFWT
jgi:hypothetical protein